MAALRIAAIVQVQQLPHVYSNSGTDGLGILPMTIRPMINE
jgi:hypothetical protein